MSRASARSSPTASPARDGRTPSARCACTWELRNAVCRRAPTPAAALPSSSIWAGSPGAARRSGLPGRGRSQEGTPGPRPESLRDRPGHPDPRPCPPVHPGTLTDTARTGIPPGCSAGPRARASTPRLTIVATTHRSHPLPQGVRLTPPGQPLHRTLGATTDRPTGAGLLPTHVALLRGINVGRGSRFALADLRPVVAELGHGRWPPTCTRATWCSPPPVTACLQRWPSG